MEQIPTAQVQAFIAYLLKIRKWSVKMLTITEKEAYLHYPIQAAVEGIIGWGKPTFWMKIEKIYMIYDVFFLIAIENIPLGLTVFHDMVDSYGLLVPRNVPGAAIDISLNQRTQVMISYTPMDGGAQNPYIIG